MGFIGGLAYQGIQLAFLALLLSSFGLIDGWDFTELGLLVGIRLCSHAVYVLPFGGLLDTSQLVHDGTYDLFLLRPVSPFAQIIARKVNILAIGDAALAIVALVAFGVYSPVSWGLLKLGYVLAAIVGGGLVEVAIQVVITSLAFKAGPVRAMQMQADRVITTFGIYPLTIFGPSGLWSLCLIFPLGFIAYLPTVTLLSRTSEVPLPEWLVLTSPLMGWALFPAALWVFRRMSRHYQSPGA